MRLSPPGPPPGTAFKLAAGRCVLDRSRRARILVSIHNRCRTQNVTLRTAGAARQRVSDLVQRWQSKTAWPTRQGRAEKISSHFQRVDLRAASRDRAQQGVWDSQASWTWQSESCHGREGHPLPCATGEQIPLPHQDRSRYLPNTAPGRGDTGEVASSWGPRNACTGAHRRFGDEGSDLCAVDGI